MRIRISPSQEFMLRILILSSSEPRGGQKHRSLEALKRKGWAVWRVKEGRWYATGGGIYMLKVLDRNRKGERYLSKSKRKVRKPWVDNRKRATRPERVRGSVVRLSLTEPFYLTTERDQIKVSSSYGRILWLMMVQAFVTYEELAEAVWPHPDDMPDRWRDGLLVRMFKLRFILSDTPWLITCVRGQGYRLEREDV